jgi:hypothetical protein
VIREDNRYDQALKEAQKKDVQKSI